MFRSSIDHIRITNRSIILTSTNAKLIFAMVFTLGKELAKVSNAEPVNQRFYFLKLSQSGLLKIEPMELSASKAVMNLPSFSFFNQMITT